MAVKALANSRQWYRIRCEADADVAEVWIYDEIGAGWFSDGVTAKGFLDEMKALPDSAKTIRVHVNSPGGDVFDAVAIANMLREQSQDKGRTVEMLIEGLAASAATIITSAGDSIKIANNAMMIVHNPSGLVMGEAKDMRSMADALDSIQAAIVTTYRWVSQLSAEAIQALMDAVTWMSADEALANGFVTEVVEPVKATACFRPEVLAKLGAIPEKYRAQIAAFASAPSVQAAEDWKVGGERGLPLTEDDAWDAGAAETSLGDDMKLWKRAHIVFDSAAPDPDGDGVPDRKGDYKFPFAKKAGGELKASKTGLQAARQRLDGSDLPQETKDAAARFIDGYLGKQEDAADVAWILAQCKTGGCLEFAEELIAAKATEAQVLARIKAAQDARVAQADYEKEIRGLCETAKLPELAEGYIAASMPMADVKTQLATITARMDAVEITTALPVDGNPPARRVSTSLNPSAIYAERAARTGQQRGV